jgi:hypothetical protein
VDVFPPAGDTVPPDRQGRSQPRRAASDLCRLSRARPAPFVLASDHLRGQWIRMRRFERALSKIRISSQKIWKQLLNEIAIYDF